MEHKTIKAAATATDQGEFSAIAAAYTVDRGKEKILPGAFKGTIERWQGSEKMIPLHWDHSGDPKDIIGTVDPSTMRESDEGLYVKGQLDLENSEVAREAWRLMKNNSVALSFGYLVEDEDTKDGVTELKALDLFEISITPAPMNQDTRILALKNADGRILTDEEKGIDEGLLKAVWTTAYVNDLPDSAFLYVESGGSKDSEGKTTPRSLRHFPYKDASGAIDLPHLRNALARIPQSSLSSDVKDRLTARAQRILDNAKAIADDAPSESHDDLMFRLTTRDIDVSGPPKAEVVPMPKAIADWMEANDTNAEGVVQLLENSKAIEDARVKEPETVKAEAQDPLSKGYETIAFRLATRGIDTSPTPPTPKVEPDSPPSLTELEREHDDLMFRLLTDRR